MLCGAKFSPGAILRVVFLRRSAVSTTFSVPDTDPAQLPTRLRKPAVTVRSEVLIFHGSLEHDKVASELCSCQTRLGPSSPSKPISSSLSRPLPCRSRKGRPPSCAHGTDSNGSRPPTINAEAQKRSAEGRTRIARWLLEAWLGADTHTSTCAQDAASPEESARISTDYGARTSCHAIPRASLRKEKRGHFCLCARLPAAPP